jgi:crossover junction endodeoxyribonuclease RuvC
VSVFLAVDPGAGGALAFFRPAAGTLEIIDMPIVEVKRGMKMKNEISPQMLAALIDARTSGLEMAIVEKVGAMPGQGSSSMYQFGRGVGMIEGVIASTRVPITYVTPQKWQRDLGVRDGKDGSRARAAELFPAYAQMFARKRDDGRSDAVLMAYWGAIQ